MKDRRVRKTEQSIQIAFTTLLKNKNFEKITVKSLCETADINKSTFYLHYKDLYDCADSLREEILTNLTNIFLPYNFTDMINNFATIMQDAIDMFKKNESLYMPFLKSPSFSSSLCYIKRTLTKKIFNRLNEDNSTKPVSICKVSFIIMGLISILEQNEFYKIDQETVASLANDLQTGFLD